ncbi:SURP domain-containing protein, partial [Herbiconiux sp. CPCC 203386]|nr:SURP domain-containing protein [Herbiconiux daphne]
MLKRNEPWHNRPCVVPMKVVPADMGNASDAEQWFGDAAYLMYRLAPDLDPDKSKYQSVWKCVIFNCRTYTDIDSADKFFRKDENHVMGRPWTDGISYYYTYPGKQIIGETNFDRDGLGYIEAKPPLKTKTLTLEQQAVWYKVGPQSEVVSYVGGLSDQTPDGFLPIRVNVEVVLAEHKTDPDSRMTRWRASIPTNSGGTADEYRIPLSQFVASYRPGTNVPYNMCTTSTVATFGPNALTTPSAKTVFLDSSEFWDGRRDSVVEIEWGDTLEDSSGVSLGLTWSTGGGKIPFGSLYYRSDVPFTITYVDSQKWHWHWDVPATAIDATTHKPVWGQFPINKSNAIFSLWQPDHPLPAYYRWMIWSH